MAVVWSICLSVFILFLNKNIFVKVLKVMQIIETGYAVRKSEWSIVPVKACICSSQETCVILSCLYNLCFSPSCSFLYCINDYADGNYLESFISSDVPTSGNSLWYVFLDFNHDQLFPGTNCMFLQTYYYKVVSLLTRQFC